MSTGGASRSYVSTSNSAAGPFTWYPDAFTIRNAGYGGMGAWRTNMHQNSLDAYNAIRHLPRFSAQRAEVYAFVMWSTIPDAYYVFRKPSSGRLHRVDLYPGASIEDARQFFGEMNHGAHMTKLYQLGLLDRPGKKENPLTGQDNDWHVPSGRTEPLPLNQQRLSVSQLLAVTVQQARSLLLSRDQADPWVLQMAEVLFSPHLLARFPVEGFDPSEFDASD